MGQHTRCINNNPTPFSLKQPFYTFTSSSFSEGARIPPNSLRCAISPCTTLAIVEYGKNGGFQRINERQNITYQMVLQYSVGSLVYISSFLSANKD